MQENIGVFIGIGLVVHFFYSVSILTIVNWLPCWANIVCFIPVANLFLRARLVKKRRKAFDIWFRIATDKGFMESDPGKRDELSAAIETLYDPHELRSYQYSRLSKEAREQAGKKVGKWI
jgi:hypothetical protein